MSGQGAIVRRFQTLFGVRTLATVDDAELLERFLDRHDDESASWEVHVIRKIMWAIFVLAALADCSCSPQNVNEKNFPPSAPANAVPDPALKALHGNGPEAKAARAKARAGYPDPSR